jgi:hypothetical protein
LPRRHRDNRNRRDANNGLPYFGLLASGAKKDGVYTRDVVLGHFSDRPPGARRVFAGVLLLALLGGLAWAVPAGRSARAKLEFFRLPSRNIACLYSTGPTMLRCDILSGVRPTPRGKCEGDWAGYSMRPTGRAGATCAGDTVYDRRAPILRYGTTWRAGGFTCSSRTTGLRCTNRSGRGFFLSRQHSYAF